MIKVLPISLLRVYRFCKTVIGTGN